MPFYEFVYDEQEVLKFASAIYGSGSDDYEPVVTYVNTRIKYGAVKSACFSRSVVLPSSIIQQLRCYESMQFTYKKQSGELIPQEHMVIYATVNTRNRRKTREAVHRKLLDYAYNPPNEEPNLVSLVSSTMMKPENGNKRWVTIDIDEREHAPAVRDILILHDVPVSYTVVTRGGYHVLVDLKDMSGDTKKRLFKNVINGMKRIVDTVSTDMPCPVPGTMQGGHRVTMVKGFPDLSC